MKTIFWNVDTQYDFMRPDGKLYIPDAEKIEGSLERITSLAKNKGIKVVNTADWHNSNSKELSDKPDFASTFPVHCMEYTKGAEYVGATSPTDAYTIDWKDKDFSKEKLDSARNIVLRKDAFDIFAGNRFASDIVKTLSPDKAVVYGVATNVCVDYAVRGLRARNIDVYVPLDAIKELPGSLEKTVSGWKDLGANLVSTDYIISKFG